MAEIAGWNGADGCDKGPSCCRFSGRESPRTSQVRPIARGRASGVAWETGASPERAAVKMKVAPHVVRVKYKTTRYSGADADTS